MRPRFKCLFDAIVPHGKTEGAAAHMTSMLIYLKSSTAAAMLWPRSDMTAKQARGPKQFPRRGATKPKRRDVGGTKLGGLQRLLPWLPMPT